MSESATYRVEQVVVQNFRRRKAELAVTQRHIQQAFAEYVPDHSRIDHGYRQSFRQMPVGLIHGCRAQYDKLRAVVFYSLSRRILQSVEHNILFASQ